jgi:hypothetical protein
MAETLGLNSHAKFRCEEGVARDVWNACATADMSPKLCICGTQGSVIDSRQTSITVTRRYACVFCGERWTTRETRNGDYAATRVSLNQLTRTLVNAIRELRAIRRENLI